ncbi:MAG: helix-turn-helix transcriptional regulator [Clostridium sp.]|jgi:transcriptional regulator with XRE-family HTH domain|uniref:helix-turn-helix domain-containing protein n=1 Tax=Clostridium sp. TaxID=1506 RepID=UPI0025C4208A|nr:helix-turn-helix transcriptional regulator [Clostridium sp.]MCH3964534.1 helix-turn-helix transcriptional regulator [Clostridium sp.]MCI1715005.1 helix-turn-helix transcriptional regulator [Clostridium sp.]MCI1799267.1 helix-turn-helix transcriptional regulator [Clostridium sp.]MCI1813188.1 helix-turn-helix transcriptional regulator [Clostridium sp.]MCI1870079.1 helix-turn-helix transcriptional regulator [Clostridium sp.]
MTASDMVIQLCEKLNISIAEVSRRIGQIPQNFNKKLKRNTVSLDELMAIADALGITFEQSFILVDGVKIKVGNLSSNIRR